MVQELRSSIWYKGKARNYNWPVSFFIFNDYLRTQILNRAIDIWPGHCSVFPHHGVHLCISLTFSDFSTSRSQSCNQNKRRCSCKVTSHDLVPSSRAVLSNAFTRSFTKYTPTHCFCRSGDVVNLPSFLRVVTRDLICDASNAVNLKCWHLWTSTFTKQTIAIFIHETDGVPVGFLGTTYLTMLIMNYSVSFPSGVVSMLIPSS